MKTDEICNKYADRKTDLTIRLLEPDGESDSPTVLIEGPVRALVMLSELLLAVAGEVENDGFSISPFGPGNMHFSSLSNMGLYIHRVDDSD